MKVRLIAITILYCACSFNTQAQGTLQRYILSAKENSPLINRNKNEKIANEAEAERIKALYNKAQIGLNANYLFAPIYSKDKNRIEINSGGADKYYGFDLGATNGGNYQALLTLTQPLFSSKRTETITKQYDINGRINDNNITLTGHDLEKLVTDQYIICLQDKKQADYAEEILRLLEQQRIIVKKLVANSLLKSTDLSLLNIEYESNAGLLITYKADYHRDLMDLNILSGIKDTALVSLDSISLSLNNRKVNSQYFRKFSLDSLSLLSGQKAFETKYKPQLSFFANTGLNAVYLPTLPNRFGVSAGLSLTWNLADGKQKTITRNKTRALLQTVAFDKENFLSQNTVRKAKTLHEIDALDKRLENLQQQLNEYQSLITISRKQIIQAQLSVIDFINILKNRSAIQRDYLLLQTNRLLLINAYNYWNW